MVNWHKNDHDQYPTLTSFKVKKKKEEMKKGVEYLERCSCGKIHYGDVGINH